MKKAVLITGAGSGIGEATVYEFSKNGYFVFLLGRDKDKLERVAGNCKFGASRIACDLTDPSQITKAVDHLKSRPDVKLEVLVNNAGIFERHPYSAGIEIWEKIFKTNLMGPVNLTQQVVPLMIAQGSGSIVNVSSTLGIKPVADVSSYCAVKAAMNNWTQSLALELAPKKIRVNCVCPGIVDTPIHPFHQLKGPAKEQTLQGLSGLQPLGRIGTPEEIAKAIYFLASENSSWTTGAILSVDGGIGIS